MLKRAIWHWIHPYNLHPNICLKTHPWGFVSNEILQHLRNSSIPESDKVATKHFDAALQFDERSFVSDARLGYGAVYRSYCEKDDFLDLRYTTPQLSCALNSLVAAATKKAIDMPTTNYTVTDLTILGSWLEMGETTSNEKILGRWTFDHIKSEIVAGGTGPELHALHNEDLTYQPVRQCVRVCYTVHTKEKKTPKEDRIDIFDWERSVMEDKAVWSVCNINSIIV